MRWPTLASSGILVKQAFSVSSTAPDAIPPESIAGERIKAPLTGASSASIVHGNDDEAIHTNNKSRIVSVIDA
ncbi:MAG: hypothetical protein AB7G68_20620 [Nitrospiraceae bacterium]